MQRKNKSRITTLNAKNFIDRIEYQPPNRICMLLKQQNQVTLRPLEVLEKVLELSPDLLSSVQIRKTRVTF